MLQSLLPSPSDGYQTPSSVPSTSALLPVSFHVPSILISTLPILSGASSGDGVQPDCTRVIVLSVCLPLLDPLIWPGCVTRVLGMILLTLCPAASGINPSLRSLNCLSSKAWGIPFLGDPTSLSTKCRHPKSSCIWSVLTLCPSGSHFLSCCFTPGVYVCICHVTTCILWG